ncbi:DUF308 domain-containing protein [Chryseobacterium sp. MFBS3-17]|uniref:DUF308 domain-containing protein n=1 Tax=Chryseobacterium sp. MFBS3-17 TaxID=2886689 RepID=UPI001D0DCA8A|nr:DUF308 domain-containing protein [Chryseobacterium sp. MFBS3-17]MCC2589714.1 C4-dicarboxylate ABC transporter [Chryseobacterium sp. MFBS3-17]
MIFNWLSFFAGVLYIILGIFVVLKFWFFVPLEPNIAYALGAVLIIYGLFRIYRAVNRMKQKKNES